jgi:RNA polymerase sigma factor (sigma-70 family)
MAIVVNDLRRGMIILYNGDLCQVVDIEFIRPGNWRALAQAKLRNLKTGSTFIQRYQTTEKVDEAMSANTRHVSVDAPFAEGDEGSLLDVLVNESSPMADRQLVAESLQAEIKQALRILNERERNVIEAFFGIGGPELTLEEIGEKYDLTRERVRQIKEKAIRRLREGTKNKILKAYLGE